MAKSNQRYDYNVDTSGVKESEENKRREQERKAQEAANMTTWQRVGAFFNNGRTKFVAGVALMLLGVYFLITFLSFIIAAGGIDQNRVVRYTPVENAKQVGSVENMGGSIGAETAQFFVDDGVGLAAFILVIWCFTIGYRLAKGKRTYFYSYSLITVFSIFATSMLIGVFTYGVDHGRLFHLGGDFGYWANDWLCGLIGVYGMLAVNLIIALTWAMLCYKTIHAIYESVKRRAKLRRNIHGEKINDAGQEVELSTFRGGPGVPDEKKGDDEGDGDDKKSTQGWRSLLEKKNEDNKGDATGDEKGNKSKETKSRQRKTQDGDGVDMTINEMKEIEQAGHVTNPHDPTGSYRNYKFPTLELLPDIKMRNESVDVDEQESNKQRITETLNNYGIKIKHITVQVGPTVTLFEIIPEDGVRVSKIRGLEDDIALSLAALGIRIIAPMPGRGTIGIEVPNREPQVVPMRTSISDASRFFGCACRSASTLT